PHPLLPLSTHPPPPPHSTLFPYTTLFRSPTMVIIALSIAMCIVNIFVIPAFGKMFASFKSELPLMTRILIGTSDVKLANILPKRSEEHTSELQSRENLVCRLLLEKKKNNQ